MAFGLFDHTCSVKARLKCPRLYKNSQQSDLFNVKVFWIWIFTAIYHSILLFWLPKAVFAHDTSFDDGTVVGQWFVGNVVYSCVVITVCLKAALELDSWTILSHFAIWGSILSWFLFLLIYCTPWLAMKVAPNMVGQDRMLYSCPLFWFSLILVPALTLMVDFVYHGIQRTFKKNTRQRIQEMELRGDKMEIENWQIGDDGLPTLAKGPIQNFKKQGSMRSGYAFSQEEGGSVSQRDIIRQYDTTLQKPTGH
jgi:phospholipid-transporting ATPase